MTPKHTSPRVMAIAFRIWAYATPKAWDVTIPEIAEALDLPQTSIMNVLRTRGWLSRVRRVSYDTRDVVYSTHLEVLRAEETEWAEEFTDNLELAG